MTGKQKGPGICWILGPFCFAVGCVGHWLVTVAVRFIPAVRGFRWRRRLLLSTVVVLGLACQLAFLIALMHCVFLACVRVWRWIAWVCRHMFYIMVYLCVFRYRL